MTNQSLITKFINALLKLTAAWSAGALLASCSHLHVLAAQPGVSITRLGTYSSGVFNAGGAEIVAHDPKSQRLYVVNAAKVSVDVVSIADPSAPLKLASVVFTNLGASANSVAVHKGIVAVAVEAHVKTNPGWLVLLDSSLHTLATLQVGAQPDMVTFSPNGRWVLVANEGEPNTYNNFGIETNGPSIDPEGSVSIVDLSGGATHVTQQDVRTAGFTAFNPPAVVPAGIRIFGPNASVAQDLEPEYITISHDSKTAWVTLQENNALAVIDIRRAKVTELLPLGYKDHSRPENGLDTSNRDNADGTAPAVNIRTWLRLKGLYQPDTIASYKVHGETFLVMANEGDARDWPGFAEEVRVNTLNLDPAFDPAIKQTNHLGLLRVTKTMGDTDGDGDYDELYVPGGRSFSIRDGRGRLVFDSGDDFERITAAAFPGNFNAAHTSNAMDGRSPNKGPEPEALALGTVSGRTYAFIGLERIGGVMIYDVSNPCAPEFTAYFNNRNFGETPALGQGGDLGPECVVLIEKKDSPNGKPLIVVGNEISGTTTIFQFVVDKKRD